ncbi:MAG: alpha/beta hydrolase [Anaerolineaceae bacterium]
MPTVPIRFTSGDVTLVGELALPVGAGPNPAVVLLHGSTWAERRFYRAHSQAFVGAGIATFSFDRRGNGESGGERDMNVEVLAADAVSAWKAVCVAGGVDAGRVGVWGYSNGAWVAGLAASRLPQAAFLVLVGASGVTPAEAEVYRRSAALRAQGISEDTLAVVARTWTIFFDYCAHGVWDASWDGELASLQERLSADESLAALPVSPLVRDFPQFDPVPHLERPPGNRLRAEMGGALPEMAYDPVPALERVRCPVLAVLAENDQNLPVPESVARFETVAAGRSPGAFQIEVLESADHLFSANGEGADDSHLRPRDAADFRPGFLEMMADWMAERTGADEARQSP